MNAKDRKVIQNLIDSLSEIKEQVEFLRDAEQEKFDNLSDGLQATDKGQKLETGIDLLDSAFSSLEEANEYLTDATQ